MGWHGPITLTSPNGQVSVNNSTASLLTGASTFTGVGDNVATWTAIEVTVFTDQNSAVNGLKLEFSEDDTNWDILNVYSITASTPFTIQLVPQSQYFRIVYVNGATNQGVFRLQTVYKGASGIPVGEPGIPGIDAVYVQGIASGVAIPVSGTLIASGTQTVVGTVTTVPTGTQAVSGTITNVPSGTQAVSGTITANAGTGTFTTAPTGTQAVSGTITANAGTGTFTTAPTGTQAVSGTITNVPSGTQAVSGTITANAGTGTFTTAPTGTQAVSGTITNVPSGTQTVAGTITNVPSGTQTVSGTITANAGTGTFTTAPTGTQTITGTVTTTPQTVSSFTFNSASVTTAAQIDASSVAATFGVQLVASPANTGTIYVGGSGVATTTGIPLVAGGSYFMPVNNVNLIYAVASTGTQTLFFTVF